MYEGYKDKQARKEYNKTYMQDYRATHKKLSKIELTLIRAMEIKIAYDLPNKECVEQAIKESKNAVMRR